MYQRLSLQGPPKFTQIAMFGLKLCTPSGNPAGEQERGGKSYFDIRPEKKFLLS
jgi:hypothetical protein